MNVDDLHKKAHERWESGDLRSAFRLFLSLAKRGDSEGQFCVAYFYDVGVGLKPNCEKAIHWYKQAYRQGMRSAASNIGTVFRDKQDLRQALSWFERAVKLDDGDANLEIARIYLRKGNEIKAVRYLRQTLKAKADDVTEGSKDEARRILRQLTKATR